MFASRVLFRYWAQGECIETPEALGQSMQKADVRERSRYLALQRKPSSELLRGSVEDAVQFGVFGSPFVFADGEPFWRYDQFRSLELWLESTTTAPSRNTV